jgi:hypothetical protein
MVLKSTARLSIRYCQFSGDVVLKLFLQRNSYMKVNSPELVTHSGI